MVRKSDQDASKMLPRLPNLVPKAAQEPSKSGEGPRTPNKAVFFARFRGKSVLVAKIRPRGPKESSRVPKRGSKKPPPAAQEEGPEAAQERPWSAKGPKESQHGFRERLRRGPRGGPGEVQEGHRARGKRTRGETRKQDKRRQDKSRQDQRQDETTH